ncbi:MAG: Gfo/Idh/MocA family oxidoreductase [Planctomycetes bacterium]|nr:Gfo/Idh/MocA family oxidoreductase [Planctomycetota bacterium]
MSKIRLGFVGVGGMGQMAHLRNYVMAAECEVVAIAELRDQMRAQVQARYAIPRAYADHRELLAKEKVDGIVAIQPFGIHGQLIPQLFSAKVPVITEKPIGRSLEAADTIISAAKKAKTPVYIAYHKRSDPATVHAKALINEWKATGEMGAMKYVRVAMPPGDWMAGGFSQCIHTDDPYPKSDQDPKPACMDEQTANDHESFVNYYIHQVNLLRHLYGEDYEVRYADPSGVLMAVQSASGVAGALEMATHRTTIDWQEHAFVGFEKGWIRIDLPAPMAIDRPGTVTVFKDPGKGAAPSTTSPTLPLRHAMRDQAENFVKAIRGETTPLCTAEEARFDLTIAKRYIELIGEGKALKAKTATAR